MGSCMYPCGLDRERSDRLRRGLGGVIPWHWIQTGAVGRWDRYIRAGRSRDMLILRMTSFFCGGRVTRRIYLRDKEQSDTSRNSALTDNPSSASLRGLWHSQPAIRASVTAPSLNTQSLRLPFLISPQPTHSRKGSCLRRYLQ